MKVVFVTDAGKCGTEKMLSRSDCLDSLVMAHRNLARQALCNPVLLHHSATKDVGGSSRHIGYKFYAFL